MRHILDPVTGKHLSECELLDKLYLDIIWNLEHKTFSPFFSDKS